MDMAAQSGPAIREEVCAACVRIILLKMAEDWAAQSRSVSRSRQVTAARVVEWIRLHIWEGIDIQQVAAHFQYNSDYLTQVLKAEIGMTLGECIHHMRMQEAKNLLLNSDMRVAEIAFAVGFGDEKYFMKAFKKAESVTPSGFRKAYFRRHLNSQ
jgi:AraC-like DNA-binding protein